MENRSESQQMRLAVGNTTEPSKVSFSNRRNSGADLETDKDSSRPLIETDFARDKSQPPIARLEIDELDDDDDGREVASTPYPGVDDGFFGNGEPPRDPDAEDIPTIGPRAGTCTIKIAVSLFFYYGGILSFLSK